MVCFPTAREKVAGKLAELSLFTLLEMFLVFMYVYYGLDAGVETDMVSLLS